MSKTFVVYLPTGDKFITADKVETAVGDNSDLLIFRKVENDIFLPPVAIFKLGNIYGWSDHNV